MDNLTLRSWARDGLRGVARRVRAAPLILVALLVILVAFAIVSPGFYSQANWLSISLYASEYLLLAVGETVVVITGGIDLSVGATLGFSGMAGALLMQTLLHGEPHLSGVFVTAIGFGLMLVVGAAIGLLNGVLIAGMKLSPFIVTLGTLGMCSAGIDLVNGGLSVSSIPTQVALIGNTTVAGWLPVPFIVAMVCAIVVWIVLAKTRFGVRTYAIGSSQLAAVRANIDVRRHLVLVYVLAGALAGVAGMMVTARFGEANTGAGAGDELTAIAAVVLGGASLFGGTGTLGGTLLGTGVISALTSGLVLSGVEPFWQPFAVGAILIFAVSVNVRRRAR
jgi:ribose transport system permease protein